MDKKIEVLNQPSRSEQSDVLAQPTEQLRNVAKRLKSLDLLRGIDLFMIVALEGVLHPLFEAVDAEWFAPIVRCLTHVEWEGFSLWDLIMPLFLFISGVSIPFAMSRYKAANGVEKRRVYWRIVKRVLLLWLFGMICQGNLLDLNPSSVYLYSNTLQAIAVGYLVSALMFLHTGWTTRLVFSLVLLLLYWAVMSFVSVGEYGGGDYTPDGNLAEWVDVVVLGRFRDGAFLLDDGTVIFSPYYHYTWILSSGNFVVSVMSGTLVGELLKNNRLAEAKKAYLIILAGVILVVLGCAWGIDFPIIKKIWTSSMVVLSTG
ncbi:MAG: acyltransferase family protein, partial [Bacteroidaceae bacterium]